MHDRSTKEERFLQIFHFGSSRWIGGGRKMYRYNVTAQLPTVDGRTRATYLYVVYVLVVVCRSTVLLILLGVSGGVYEIIKIIVTRIRS
jgi:hypothetical protein